MLADLLLLVPLGRNAPENARTLPAKLTTVGASCSAMTDFDPAPGGEVSFGEIWTVLGVEAECPLSLGRADVPIFGWM
jgi:hypothetical protein